MPRKKVYSNKEVGSYWGCGSSRHSRERAQSMVEVTLIQGAAQIGGAAMVDNFVAAMTPGGIEAQEARGQRTQVVKDTLPRELRDAKCVWEQLGFKFGQPEDDLFQEVEFPKGWKKVITDHAMWTDIVDDKGNKRGSIFYKAAFYDRSAFADLNVRFCVRKDPSEKGEEGKVFVHDALGLVDFSLPTKNYLNYPSQSQEQRDAFTDNDNVHKQVQAWLDENYPDNKNPTAYWN